MRRTRRALRSLPKDEDTSDEEDKPSQKRPNITPPKTKKQVIGMQKEDSSSSESDIEMYLQPISQLDLNSTFFNPENVAPLEKPDEKELKAVSQLSSSEAEDEDGDNQKEPSTTKQNFQEMQDYMKNLEEAQKKVDEYNAKRAEQANKEEIIDMLKSTESNINSKELGIDLADLHSSDFESCSDSEKGDWEEVKNAEAIPNSQKSSGAKDGLQITVEMPEVIRKKKGTDLLAAMKRRLNRIRKENQVEIHKVHLLCWLGHGNYVNSILNCENTLSLALSLLPNDKCYPDTRTDLKYLEQILKWYRKAVTLNEKNDNEMKDLRTCLMEQIEKREVVSKKMLVLSLQVEPLRPPASELCSLSTKNDESITCQRAKTKTKVKSRTTEAAKTPSRVASTAPKLSLASKVDKAIEVTTNTQKSDRSLVVKTTSSRTKKEEKPESAEMSTGAGKRVTRAKSQLKKNEPTQEDSKEQKLRSKSSTESPKSSLLTLGTKTRSKSSSSLNNNAPKKKDLIKVKLPVKTRSKKEIPQVDGIHDSSSSDDDVFLSQLDGANDDAVASTSSSRRTKPNLKKLQEPVKKSPVRDHSKRSKGRPKYKDTDSEDDDFVESPPKRRPSPNKDFNSPSINNKSSDFKNDIVKLMKGRIKEEKQKDLMKIAKTKRKTVKDDSDDSDFAPEPVVKKPHPANDNDITPKTKVKRRINPKAISSDEEISQKKKTDFWAEVFLESEEKWISVDVINGRVHCVKEIFKMATAPMSYVVAWNNDNSLKDITARYCQNFNTVTRKLRVDSKWWQESLKPFAGTKTARDREEDEELERQQLEKPLPTSIGEYKDHPLYVLKRHLLKFQAIYPPDAPTLGFIRKEAVYSRQCVYTLHSRDIWLKHAKTVKMGETPYKIVKARPKYDKLSNSVITDQLLEIFGPWQTEDYVPPTAENGVVPRNAFGNVELFKSCMLPKKTVHLQLPGLNKVAKKLNIDCASAVVGFDFHGGWSHPTFDGFVVCEEFRDVLVEAWEKEQLEIEIRENEKVEKRVYGNWKKLIRGLLIRERLKAKYDFGGPSGVGGGKEKKKSKGPKFGTKKRSRRPDNRSDSRSD